jgi:DMSO/TMAO reductase YedYZ molybdopterin-dependent catalytic subunit
MGLIFPNQPTVSRRQFLRQSLQWSSLAGTGLLLNGCSSNFLATDVGNLSEPLNQTIEAWMLSQKPVPEFAPAAIEPDKLLINSFNMTPEIDLAAYRLVIDGEVEQPLSLTLQEIQAMPYTSMVIRHVCVEGWAAIVQWGGVRLQHLLSLAKPKALARYVYFRSADAYHESWDIASALHPQTLMVYSKNGAPLPMANGAPLRLAAPIKLGYKQSKWVNKITVTSKLLPERGYWVDKGYEWFAGV